LHKQHLFWIFLLLRLKTGGYSGTKVPIRGFTGKIGDESAQPIPALTLDMALSTDLSPRLAANRAIHLPIQGVIPRTESESGQRIRRIFGFSTDLADSGRIPGEKAGCLILRPEGRRDR